MASLAVPARPLGSTQSGKAVTVLNFLFSSARWLGDGYHCTAIPFGQLLFAYAVPAIYVTEIDRTNTRAYVTFMCIEGGLIFFNVSRERKANRLKVGQCSCQYRNAGRS